MNRPAAPVGVHRVCVNDLLAGPPGVAPVTPEDNANGPAREPSEHFQPTRPDSACYPATSSR
jgi:hypothetical protein